MAIQFCEYTTLKCDIYVNFNKTIFFENIVMAATRKQCKHITTNLVALKHHRFVLLKFWSQKSESSCSRLRSMSHKDDSARDF